MRRPSLLQVGHEEVEIRTSGRINRCIKPAEITVATPHDASDGDDVVRPVLTGPRSVVSLVVGAAVLEGMGLLPGG